MTNLAETTRRFAARVRRRSSAARTSHPSALQCVVASNEFGSYCVPKASLHRPAAQAILRGKVWEPETVAFLRDNCGSGDIVHAGTYFGDFLPGICAALGEGSKVWAFEPSSENYRCASITVELNGLHDRIRLTRAALGPVDGAVMISVLDDSGRALGGGSHVGPAGKERVTQVALDGFIPEGRRVSILQLDVEGYEEQALRGSEHLIKRDSPILILETIPASDWFRALLSDCGYIFEKKLAQNSAFVSRRAQN
jgi:FkbM family methyltransferase